MRLITNPMRKLILFIAAFSFAVYGAIAQVVTNTNPAGPGSLQAAVTAAKASAGPQTITFNIPGAAPFLISPGTLALNSATPASILIDATTQAGYTPGNPVVILKGSGTGNCFDVSMSNLTIKGFIVQSYTNGYLQSSGNLNSIETCWFGVNAAGTAAVTNKDYGILINGGSVAIGSQTDFTSSTRNIISGSGISGIKFQTATAASYIGNSFIGTDKTGSIAIGNGWDATAGTEFRHGVTINATASITFKNNVISGNYSGGIDITGNSANTIITGNKIGTNFLGTLPLGNRNFGIRIKNSGGHTIGGAGVGNIISANGSSDYPFEQNTTDPAKFDWYNACGIYLFNSSNNVISGNKIGVDISGNSYAADPKEMGNFYCGLKIDGTSANNKVGVVGSGNIVGQNGFRSSIAAGLAGLCCLDGHGMIVKDATTTATVIVANNVGVGLDGTSKIGNKQDGISIQGSSGTKIGGTTAGERNVIGDNTWGIFIASNYYNSQTSNCQILGNYIGTNATGNAPIGNGMRSDNTSGGGIGIIHFTQGTLVGGAAAGSGNVISGNRIGISMLGNSPIAPAGSGSTTAKVYGNYIGLGANGTTIVKNEENGIFISEKANNNDIGGINADEGNKIAGNGQNGIYSQDATNNRIRGNSIYSNEITGIGFDKTTTNTIQNNFIYSNQANGINLTGLSNGNSLFGNTIGDLIIVAKGNTGDGISITGSSNNIIGGVNAGEGNTIANNTANAISILGATSNNNSIHRNIISCNGSRGIELNGVGNGNYAAPTFSGSETALVVTGPAGSTIELFSLDACNNCSGTDQNKLQGKTFITSFPSGTTYAGTAGVTYTATASFGNTTAAHRTSEFSDCYTLCPPADLTLLVKGNSPVCLGNTSDITIQNSEAGQKYQVFNGATSVSSLVNGTGSDLVIPISLTPAGTYVISVKVSAGTCAVKTLNLKPTIVVNDSPDVTLGVNSNSPVCVGNSAIVTIVKSELNKTYEVYNGATSVSSVVTGTGNDLPITLNALPAGTYTMTIKVGVGGCVSKNLNKQPVIVINNNPDVTLGVNSNSPVCVGNAAIVTIVKSELNKTYEVYNGATSVSSVVTGTGNDLPITLNALPAGTYTMTIKAGVGGCVSKNLNKQPVIVINNNPDVTLGVNSNSPVCVGNAAIVTIVKSELNKTYEVYNGATSVSSVVTGTGNDLPITLNALPAGTYTMTIKVGVGGCISKNLNKQPVIVINDNPDVTLGVNSNSPVCVGNAAIVTIIKSELNKTYEVYNGATSVSSVVTGTGNDLPITLNALPAGTYTMTIKVGVGGCTSKNLNKQPVIVINDNPKIDSDIKTNSPICFGVQGILKVVSAEAGKSYQVFDENGAIASPLTPSLVNDTLSIKLNSLPIGPHTLTVKASVPGCLTATLSKKVQFSVNKGLDGALSIKYDSIICLGTTSAITIIKSESGVEYQAFNDKDNTKLSDPVIGDGLDKVVTLYPLTAGTTVVYFKAFIGGCGSVRLGNNAKIKVNTDPNKGLDATATSPICFGEVAIVTIPASETDKSYQVFENKVSVSSIVPGNTGLINLNVPNLAIGDHKFTINVTVPGCKSDTLLKNPTTKVNSSPDSTLKVGTNGPVCDGNQAVFYILKSQPGKKYEIFNGLTSVSQQKDGNGDTLKINLTNLIPGTYILTAKATSAGCTKSIDLKDKGTITINKNPKKDLNATVNGPVCLGNPTEVTVELAEDGKFYEVFYNGKSISASTKGSGADLKIPISTTIIPAGSNLLSIGISVPGCIPDTLTNKPVLEINTKASDSLLVTAVVSPICVGTDGAVRITGIQPKVSYQAYLGTDSVSQTLTGPGPDIILPIPASKLLPGLNNISVKAYIKGCTVSDLKDTAGIKVNPNPKVDLAISVDPSTICEGGESNLTISTTEAGVSYQAVVGSKPYSSAVLSTGGEVKLTVFGLPQGTNIVGVEASVQGCLKKNLDSTVTIIVNKGPKLDYGVTGSTVCIGDSGKLTISGSEAGVLYQAFEKTSNGIFSRKVTGTGNEIVIILNPSTNPSDTIIVKAEITGCGIVRLENSGILITNDKNVSKKLSTAGSTICINDGNATATIKSAIKDVSYEATFNSTKQPAQIGTGGDLVFNLPTSTLKKGSYVVTFTATVQACGPVDLDSAATVIINDNKSSKDLLVKGSDICLMDASGTATILSAIEGVSYQASINGVQLPEILVGKGVDLIFTIPVAKIDTGVNIVSFVATIAGCTPVDLSNKATINRNDNTTSKNLATKGSTVCANDPNATSTIISAKSGISYQAFLGTKAVSDKLVADGSDLVLSIATNQLASGQNVISFMATVAGCAPVKLDNDAIVVVLGERYVISGSSLRCYSTTGDYSITPVAGISVYKWTVPEGAKITSDSTGTRITVAFGEKSGKVTVTPVGNIGACDGISSELFVSVEPPFNDTLSILGDTMVCLNDKRIIAVDTIGVIGVDYIVWTISNGIHINDTINKKSIFRKFNVSYIQTGTQLITATPHERCSDTFLVPDTLKVKVLSYPIVNAGDYPLIENDLTTSVNLDGNGSSLNGTFPNDSLTYKWFSYDREVQINNQETLNSASFVPKKEETIVYLKITNRNGMCPVFDSALVKVALKIEIPNIFTPNGDGVHDRWEIKNLHKLYPNCSVEVFNKWGSYIFKSNGYYEPWDGTRNGEDLPVATYYYVVDFKDGSKPRTGSITIIR